MHTIIRAGKLTPNSNGTILFEGEAYGSEVSIFVMNTPPGKGPDLHFHPYSETWVIRAGTARFSVDGEQIDAGPGDILVAEPHAIHGFKNMGTEHVEIVCVHASPRVIQTWLEE